MNQRIILRRDPDFDCLEGAEVEFHLTFEGELRAHMGSRRLRGRPHHVHEIRQCFHVQLKELWQKHPVLSSIQASGHSTQINLESFVWQPIVTNHNGLICKLEVLMLRTGEPGRVLTDIDNRLKTLFDALKMPDGPEELGSKAAEGQVVPGKEEHPFYVLLQDDKLITHVAVNTDMLLQPVANAMPENAVRLVIGVRIGPYRVGIGNIDYV